MNDKLVRTTERRMRFQFSLAIVSVFTLLPVVGFASGNKSQQSKSGATAVNDNFARADENHDGKLSRGEARGTISSTKCLARAILTTMVR